MARWIGKYYIGVASDEEQKQLEEWLDESSLHREELQRIREEVVKGRPECPKLDEMWIKFEQRIPVKSIRRRRIFQYAALFFIPLCLSVYLYFKEHPAVLEVVPVTEEVVPGKVKAQLILADGKELNITGETLLDIRETGNARISTTGDVLQYEETLGRETEVVLKYNTLIVPVGGEFSLLLSDGTRVWLNAGSKLKYPVVFAHDVREVEMEGEVYFEVKHNEHSPFIVKINGVEIRVLGTSFNVSGYQGEVVTTLISGKVSLTKGENNLELHPGEQAVLESGQSDFKVHKVNAQNYGLWKEGIFWFSDTELDIILEQLARWYNLNVSFLQPDLKKIRFSLEMKRYDDIEAVLRKIAYTQKVKFSIEGRTVRVMK